MNFDVNNFINESLTQLFSCEFCKISKNNFFIEHLRMTASGYCISIRSPADTDVFKTSSGRFKKITTSCDQTRRRHDVCKKTSNLQRLEDV